MKARGIPSDLIAKLPEVSAAVFPTRAAGRRQDADHQPVGLGRRRRRKVGTRPNQADESAPHHATVLHGWEAPPARPASRRRRWSWLA